MKRALVSIVTALMLVAAVPITADVQLGGGGAGGGGAGGGGGGRWCRERRGRCSRRWRRSGLHPVPRTRTRECAADGGFR